MGSEWWNWCTACVLLVYMLHVHARGGKWYVCLYNLHVTFMHVGAGVSGEMGVHFCV